MGRSFNHGLLVGIVAIVASLVVNATLAYWNTRQLDEDAAWVAHTQGVLGLIGNAQLTLMSVETCQRGFLLTGNDNLLQSYHPALTRLDQSLAELKVKTKDNPRQQNRIPELEQLIAGYLSRLQAGIDQRRKGPVETPAIQSLLTGNQQMDAIRDLMAAMAREETELLQSRELKSRRAYGVAVTSGFLATALALALIAALVLLLRRNLLARKKAEESVRRVNAALEERVETRTTELRKTTDELATSNLDLEQFAYVASHDLQEPLRAVAGCVQVLKRRYQGQLDARADELIAHTVDGASRMQALIEDLLTFSRIGTAGKAFQPCDCNTALDRALANLETAIQEAAVVVTHDDLPVVAADAAQITQLFQNLVGNAIKFHGSRPPTIHVGVVRDGTQWAFTVRDNGIGMAAEYFERVFVVFQRLHTRTEYPGTGIGLAICKKIVERHGGVISVASIPGEGSTFSFTLPDKAVNQ